jgi:hypothetical protein
MCCNYYRSRLPCYGCLQHKLHAITTVLIYRSRLPCAITTVILVTTNVCTNLSVILCVAIITVLVYRVMVVYNINFVDHANDTTMVPDSSSSSSTLRSHLSTRPPSRLRGSAPPRPTVVDAVRTRRLHLRAPPVNICSKDDAPRGEWRSASPSSDLGGLDLMFPPEQPE